LTIPAPETKAAEPADVAESFYIPANGDTTALRLCMERILPTRKDRPVSFDMPRIETVADSVKAAAAIASAVADSNLTPSNKPQRHGPKRTRRSRRQMSAFGGKADIGWVCGNVR